MFLRIKKIFLIISLLTAVVLASAQETTKVSSKQKINCYTLKETYHVLKSDPGVKQGNYTASIPYFSEKGQYEQGKKTGIWEFYRGLKLIHKYDFNTQTFLADTKPQFIGKITLLDDNGNPLHEIELQNVYLGGDGKMQSILIQCIRYPGPAVQNHVTGKVHISAMLTQEGKLINEKTESNIGYGLEEEAVRVFRMFPPDWVPVRIDGKPVPVKLDIIIGFSLS